MGIISLNISPCEDCELFFYMIEVSSTTISYEILSNSFPVTVDLKEGGVIIDTNIHLANGIYSFTGSFTNEYTIDFTDACGVIISEIVSTCNCPEGYTAIGDGCRLIEITEATIPTDPQFLVSKSHYAYSAGGTIIYSNYNTNGSGTVDRLLTTDWWKNTSLSPVLGPLNRTGVWSEIDPVDDPGNQQVGFTVCINLVETKTYYIGLSADNYATIRINGVDIIIQDYSAIYSSLYSQGTIPILLITNEVIWRYWMVYPIILEAGKNIIEIIGNDIGYIASVGCEIYDATPDELEAITSYNDFGDKLLFSSKDEIGNPVQIGDLGYGYSCPDGYSLVLCDGAPYCRKITEVNCI